jgi:hypothetical protein
MSINGEGMGTVLKRVLTAGLVASLLCLAFAASAAASLLPFDPEWTAAEVGYLVAAGAEVNARDENGWTPLMFAAAWADIETVSVLFEAGADVNASSTSGWTALMSAMACGNWPQVVGEFRLVGLEDDWSWDWGDEDAGDDWGWDDWWDDDDDWEWDDEEDWSWENWYDDDEDWPEEAASPWREPNPLVIRSLVAAGADVNVCTEDGWTPLMIAVLCNADCEIVEDLIAAGAEVNARNEFGQTPLILAVENDTDIGVGGIGGQAAAGRDGDYGGRDVHPAFEGPGGSDALLPQDTVANHVYHAFACQAHPGRSAHSRDFRHYLPGHATWLVPFEDGESVVELSCQRKGRKAWGVGGAHAEGAGPERVASDCGGILRCAWGTVRGKAGG